MHSYLWWPLLAWLLPLGGALGSRAHLWPWWLGFALCLASALISLWLLLRLPWRYRSSPCLWADAWGIAPLLLPLLFVVQALRSPLTNDVSTDPHHPPRLLWAEQLRTAQDLPVNAPPLASFSRQRVKNQQRWQCLKNPIPAGRWTLCTTSSAMVARCGCSM